MVGLFDYFIFIDVRRGSMWGGFHESAWKEESTGV